MTTERYAESSRPARAARDRVSAMTNEAAPGLASDLLELAKPRITALVTLTTAAGFAVATPYGEFPWPLFACAAVGTALVSGGSAAFNQLVERALDARMRRTARRPLPAGRRSPALAAAWGTLLAATGLLLLALFVNALTAAVALATLVVYDLVYTPMKTRTAFATIVGAVPGAAPPVIGWTAATGELGLGAWLLFALLFLWQLPHFLSIAWLYREDYRRAGMHLLTIDDPDARRTARQTVVWTVALLPVSMMPAAVGLGGGLYLAGAAATGLAFLAAAVAFARAPRVESARRLLLVSVFYLPAVLGVLVVDQWWVL
jgi:protoheme IX farnesyltransferase